MSRQSLNRSLDFEGVTFAKHNCHTGIMLLILNCGARQEKKALPNFDPWRQTEPSCLPQRRAEIVLRHRRHWGSQANEPHIARDPKAKDFGCYNLIHESGTSRTVNS